jgi:hypothetical protein
MTTATLTPNGNAAKSANVITHLTARAIHVRAVSQANVLFNSSIAAGSINSAHANMIRSIPAAACWSSISCPARRAAQCPGNSPPASPRAR